MLAQKMLAHADQFLRLRNAAIAHIESGDLVAAHQDLDSAVALAPDDAKMRVIRGAVRALMCDHRGAVADFHRVVTDSPHYREAWLRLGECQLQLQDYDAAMYSLGRAIALDPALPDAWLEQGKALHKKRWYPEAIAYYEQALLLDEHCEEALFCQRAAVLAKDYEDRLPIVEATPVEWNDGPTIPKMRSVR